MPKNHSLPYQNGQRSAICMGSDEKAAEKGIFERRRY
jgi:hypothetical protein